MRAGESLTGQIILKPASANTACSSMNCRMVIPFVAMNGGSEHRQDKGPFPAPPQAEPPPQARAALVRPGAAEIASPANDPALAPPEHGRPFQFPFFNEPVSYHEAMETRLVRGDWGSGRVAAWMRQRVPLVAGTPTSPLERVLVAADSRSGGSAAHEPKRLPPIHAHPPPSVARPPGGEWV